ncbi:MlaD family protein [Flavobacterium sp.]|uniref:MlaD family protein n=1 Tax=Flavobacterium sp. TaxID=239 RepID=UPI00262B8EA6|nr:MlaD family protein [Flavobacterium sp.]
MKNKKTNTKTWKLGLFVIISLTVFLGTVYFIGKSQNLFGSTFHLQAKFKNVNGLSLGNNVLLSGINIGTIKEIEFVSDSILVVKMVVRSEIQQYIKIDALATIGSDGLMGDKVLMISPGSSSNEIIKDNAFVNTVEAIEMTDLMNGLKKSIDYTKIITKELSEFSYKINSGKGALSKVLTDEEIAKSIEKTMTNLETGTNQLVIFSEKLNDKNGTISKLLTDPMYANSIKKMVTNFEKSSVEVHDFTKKLNNDSGIVHKLLTDEKTAQTLDSTFINLKSATKKLNELEEAIKRSFLFRGNFKRQAKVEAKLLKQKQDSIKK